MANASNNDAENLTEEDSIKRHLGHLFIDALLSNENAAARAKFAEVLAADVRKNLTAFVTDQQHNLAKHIEEEKSALSVERDAFLNNLESSISKAHTFAANLPHGDPDSNGGPEGHERYDPNDTEPSSGRIKQFFVSSTSQNEQADESASFFARTVRLWVAIFASILIMGGAVAGWYFAPPPDSDKAEQLSALCEEFKNSDGPITDPNPITDPPQSAVLATVTHGSTENNGTANAAVEETTNETDADPAELSELQNWQASITNLIAAACSAEN